jgi:hypothetical protein
VVRALGPLLRAAAPFDAGEVAVACPIGFERWTLSTDEQPVAGEDFLLHLTARRQVVRIDEPSAAEPFRRTRAALQRAGLQSLLALPFAAPGGLEGAIVLARSYPWAFVAAPLRLLLPVARMAGLALEHSRALGRLAGELTRPRPPEPRSADVDEALRLAAEAEDRLAEAEAEKALLLAGTERRDEQIARLGAELEALRHAPRRRAPVPKGPHPKES